MSQPYLGEIIMFAGNFAPRGRAFCNGQILSIAQNEALFALLGTTYGGNGQTTFALPDLQGRLPIHQSQGPGLSNYVVGQAAGVSEVTLNTSQIPAHVHSLVPAGAGSGAANTANPVGAFPAASAAAAYSTAAGGRMAAGTEGTIAASGGNQPHTNLMPFLAVSFVIALEGIFPSTN